MSDLYPSFDMPDIVGATENTVVAFPKSWLWDWDICDFVQTGSGDVVEVDGLTAWAQWCVKAILTQRLAFVVYDWNYGADIESCLKQPTRAVTEAELEREITEALLTDPRTAEVKNFRFEWSGDELTVWFTVVNALGQPAEIQVGVGYREVQRQFSLSKTEQYISDWLRGELVNVEPTENGELVIKSVAQPTFTRNSIAYKSDGSQVAANQPRFEQGQFGKAIMMEEGTTNLFPLAKSVVVSGGSDPYEFWVTSGLVQGGTYTLRALIKAEVNDGTVGSRMCIMFNYSDGTSEEYSTGQFPKDGIEREYVLTRTADATKTLTSISGWILDHSDHGTGKYQSARNIQLEAKPYATSFIDGTRAAETPTIPTAGVLNPQEGTVEFTVIPQTPHVNPGGDPWFNDFTWGSPGTNGFLIRRGVDTRAVNCFQVEIYGTPAGTVKLNYDATFQQGTPYAIAFRWSALGCAFFVDGVKRAETTYLFAAPSATEAQIGYRPYHRQGNALYDDLRISSRARTDEEIAAAYASGQPLPIDENTTYALRFDNSLKVGRGGYRLSKPVYLKSLGTCNGSNISWEANIPAGCDVKVYASVDGSTFQECENNAPIPSLSEGVSLVDKVLVIKEVLLTEDGVNRPELMAVRYNVDGTVTLRG